MRGNTLTIEQVTEFYVEECFKCGCSFAMTKDFRDNRMRDKDDFWCPAGHPQRYIGKSDKQLRQEAEARARAAEDQAAAAERATREAKRQLTAAKREATRLKTRAANGVCPCCNRSFVQLARHMKTKHPEYVDAT